MRSSTPLAALLVPAAPSLAFPTFPKLASLLENRSSGTLSVWKLATPLCDNETPADWRWISPAADCLEYRDRSGASQPVYAVGGSAAGVR
ncbi:hypothetical protein F4821DRAFT_255311 [Hypoxylon rubiginosum]|uniref:Uncharacterized protein n=1 Tax=Hypoxylon rubiginosum TaxID=110542 RepID=A0ACC0DE73_9PEZI|nr:hypothetical protein F4821DRAFT_255311 [Hypoxylon rubiginosum]